MSEIIDPNSIRANTPDWQEGYEQGKKFAQNKVLELMDEVIAEYEELTAIHSDDEAKWDEEIEVEQAQLNAVKFMKSWVLSGGQTDEDGNRVCLVW